MAKKAVKKKQSYGGCSVDHFSPPAGPAWPKAINIILSFEDALKLQLALQGALLDINSMKRSTREGKVAAANVCLYTRANRITVNPAKTKP